MAVLFLLSLFLQSCIPPTKLAYGPNKGVDNERETLSNGAHPEHFQPSLVSSYSFTSSSGAKIVFFQEEGIWKAKVTYPWEIPTTRVLPVVCEHERPLLPILQRLSQQGVQLQKQVIHILDRAQDQWVFIEDLGFEGGVLPGEVKLLGLHEAIVAGDLERLKGLLARNTDPNIADENGITPLHLASIKGYLAMVALLLAHKANPNLVDKSGETPLHRAAYCGHLELVNLLLEKGAEVNAKDLNGFSPIHLAIEQGHVAIVNLLLASGADPNLADATGFTLLHWAVYYDNLALVNLFLKKGADMNAVDVDGFSPIHLAIEQGHVAIARLLLESGVNPNLADESGLTLLHWAAYDGNLELVELCLEKGAALNAVDVEGFTPIHLAIEQGHIAIVRLLLATGINPNMADASGFTLLHWAVYDGNLELVELCLEKGADPTLTSHKNCTPLHIAAYRGHMPIIFRLLSCGIDINAQDDYGSTFLHKLVDNERMIPEERLHRFLGAMQGIEKNHYGLLRNLTAVMEDHCPELTNEDGQTILAMMVDYVQGVDLSLKNQTAASIVAIVEAALVGEAMGQDDEEIVKILDRHQKLGEWMRSCVQNKRKVSLLSNITSQEGLGEPASKRAKASAEN